MAREFFKDLPNTTTPLTASRLNGLLDGDESLGKIVIESITSKNLFSTPIYNSTGTAGTTYSVASNNDIIINSNGVKWAYVRFSIDNIPTGTELTFSCDFSSTNSNAPVAVAIYDSTGTNTLYSSANMTGSTGNITGQFTTTTSTILIAFGSNNSSTALTNIATFASIQIEKGSIATTYVPYKKYGYNSTESMGDIVVDNITCKNIFDGYLEEGSYSQSTGEKSTSSTQIRCANKIKVEPNTTYIVSLSTGVISTKPRIFYYSSSSFLSSGLTDSDGVFTTGDDVAYITFASANYTTSTKFQIEKGETATSYTSHEDFGYVAGTNNNGNYVKYSDGRLECWGTKTLSNVPVTTATGSMYRSDYQNSIAFPETFTSIDMCNLFLQGSTYASMIAPEGSPTVNYTQAYYIYRSTSSTLTSLTIGYHAIGRWK